MCRVTLPDGAEAADEPDLAAIFAQIDAAPVPTGSAIDRWWARLLSTPRRLALWNWGGPALVVILAAVLRLVDLGHPHALVFDETYYVKDAWTLIHNGFESTWPGTPDPKFNSGDVNFYVKAPEFVAHPPLGKWIIGLGEAVLGVQSAWGWRITTALFGILAVVLVMFIAKKLFKRTFIAVVAGFLMAIEGNAIVMSRLGLLDDSVMFFALLGFAFVLLDREQHERRVRAWVDRERLTGDRRGLLGPIYWNRPWMLAAGLALGLDSGVKWSGIYFLAVFAVYTVMSDMLLRRRLGIPLPIVGAWLKQGPASLLLTVPIALAGYLATWTGWLLTTGGWDREWVQQNPSELAKGLFAWAPHWAQNLWYYSQQMYQYSITLHVSHPYKSNPLFWPFMTRPTSMYWAETHQGQNGCTVATCTQAITDLANPLIWWAGTASIIFMIVLFAWKRDWIAGALLAGYGAGWLPWVLLYSGRTIFTFYSIAFEPYMILALAYAIAKVIGTAADPTYRRVRGLWIAGSFMAVAIALSIFFWPIWTGQQISYDYWSAHMWFRSWI